MTNFDVIELNPTVAHLQELAKSFHGLEICWVDDKAWYNAVKNARIKLKNTRVELTKMAKELREWALKFQRDVIAKEKELIWIIEPLEDELQKKQDVIDELIAIEKRKNELPFRRWQLDELAVEMTDEEILKMDDKEFYEFIQVKKQEKLLADQKALQDAQDKLEKDRFELENQKRLEQAKIDAQEAEKKKAEENRIEARKTSLMRLWFVYSGEKAGYVRQHLIVYTTEIQWDSDEDFMTKISNLSLEIEKIKKEADDERKRIADEQVQKAKDEAEEKNRKYQKWLATNWYNENEFIILEKNGKKLLYKFVADYVI